LRILFISHLYHPEPGAQPARVRNLTQRWAAAGHDVTILAGVPNHPNGKIYPGHKLRAFRGSYTEWDGQVRIARVVYFMRPNRGAINRLVSFSSFTLLATMQSVFMRPYDVVIGTIPQPFAPLAAYLRSAIGNAKFVLDVRDLWPEGLTATGQSSENSMSYKVIGAATSFLYKKADQIVAVTDGIRDSLLENHPLNPEDTHIVRAAVDLDYFQTPDAPVDQNILDHTRGKFVISYIGTMGNAHGLEHVVEAAQILEQNQPGRFAFVIAGTGAEEQVIRNLVETISVTNVLCTGQVDRDQIPGLLHASDVALASLRPSPVFETVVPTKIYEYMAAGLPVLSNVAGETKELIARSKSGITVEGGNATAIASGITELANDPAKLAQFGKSGVEFVKANVSWEASADTYLKVLERAISN
jgi:colanic acid biosynthesis glycosyl transferase WcaI